MKNSENLLKVLLGAKYEAQKKLSDSYERLFSQSFGSMKIHCSFCGVFNFNLIIPLNDGLMFK